ncbi:MAG: DUF4340 domain-containing protein [Planctomycetes bacterium]|nr:DUF4340 domain-containing protein [Planctomycetota bacterium]
MNQVAKTGIAVGAAVGLSLLALSMGPREVRLAEFDDQGQEFWPTFKDGASVTELEVVEFREATGEPYPFVVKRDDKGRWTIPSHGNYPADAKDRMGKAAAMLLGLKKQAVVGDVKGRHVDYGVVDPLESGAETKGRGKHIRLKDSAANVLADLIVGKAVEGKTGEFYVRVPDKKRVYRVKLDGELSTKFADWIETDLLKASSWDIAKVTFDNYSIDEQRGAIVPGDKLVVGKDDAGKWTFAGLDAEKEESNEDKLREIGDTLGQIKIVGVRQKPEGLTARLERANGIEAQLLAQSLQQKGFFLDRSGKLFSNEGDLLFETKKGVRYTLRFGELVLGDGDEVTSGIADPKQKPKEGEAAKAGNNRYLMVTAEFDEALLPKPAGVRLPADQLQKRTEARTQIEAIQRAVEAFRTKHENKLPETLAKLTEKPAEGDALLAELKKDPWDNDYQLVVVGEGYAIVSFADGKAEGGEGAAQDVRSDRLPLEDELKKVADAWAEFDRKVEDGKKEADKLTKRFGPWYYVIDQALFGKLKPKRADLVKPKAAPAPVDPANPGATQPGK